MDVQPDCARPDVSGVGRKRESADRGTGQPRHHRRIAIFARGSGGSSSKPALVIWAESFIFAGSSALLLLVVNSFPEYWYVSFFALTPFLYRIIKATCGELSRTAPGESLRLGLLLGLCFFGVSIIDSPLGSPLPSLLKLLWGTGLFALFGWAVGQARHRWGFNPSVVAVLWVGLEMGLLKLGVVGGVLGETKLSHPYFGGLFALFGFLAVSAIVVLLNSLLVLLILKTLAIKIPRGKIVQEDRRTWDLLSTPGLLTQKIYIVPEGRAPPFHKPWSIKLQLDPGKPKGLHSSCGKLGKHKEEKQWLYSSMNQSLINLERRREP